MARIERKAYYVGTWREDHVTDTTMRQIIARSHAEKGQKVKVKLSKDGLNVSRTVLFQENFLSSFPLSDVYFLTVNPHHPTCLLCIVADPVKKYLILVLRTVNDLEAKDLIATFQRLKSQPVQHGGGNVVLKRKDDGNWTLRERSQHNANRHLQQVFREASFTSDPSSSSSGHPTPRQPNGHVIGDQPPPLSPFFDEGVKGMTTTQQQVVVTSSNNSNSNGTRRGRAHSASQTTTGAEGSEEEVALMRMEVETLTQELRDLKLVLEKAGTLNARSPRDIAPTMHHTTTTNNNNHHHTETSHIVTADVQRTQGGHKTSNGPLVTAYSVGEEFPGHRAGEARVYVEDHRGDSDSQLKTKTAVHKPLFSNGKVQRQITVPEPNFPPPRAVNGQGGDSSYTIQRRVVREPALMSADAQRKLSSTHSLKNGGGGIHIVPAPSRRGHDRHNYFRSMRVSRTSGVPTTVVKPIEQIYAHGNHTLRRHPVMLVKAQAPYVVQDPAQDVYIAQQMPGSPTAVYVANDSSTLVRRAFTPTGSLRGSVSSGRSRLVQDSEVRALHADNGELDDVLL